MGLRSEVRQEAWPSEYVEGIIRDLSYNYMDEMVSLSHVHLTAYAIFFFSIL